jgi:hypothetical protein
MKLAIGTLMRCDSESAILGSAHFFGIEGIEVTSGFTQPPFRGGTHDEGHRVLRVY